MKIVMLLIAIATMITMMMTMMMMGTVRMTTATMKIQWLKRRRR